MIPLFVGSLEQVADLLTRGPLTPQFYKLTSKVGNKNFRNKCVEKCKSEIADIYLL